MWPSTPFALMLAGLMLAGSATAAPMSCSAMSTARTLPLVELYTSEGCDSCPPADRWLHATFPSGTGATAAAAVLAFHVDYWNDLGWTDRFARHEYTIRQQDAVRAQHARTVYTPQLLVQGRDRGLWRGANVGEWLRTAAAEPARARIEIGARATADAVIVEVKAAVVAAATEPVVYVALTESGLSSTVTAGENAGVRLVHDHVVRVLSRPVAFAAGRPAAAVLTLPLPAERGHQSTVIAFVQDRRSGEILQALALPLCDGS